MLVAGALALVAGDVRNRITRKRMEPVTTMQIYRGAIPFLIIQLTMVGLLIAFPQLVTGALDKKVEYNMESLGDQMRESLGSSSDTESYGEEPFGASEEPAPDAPDADAPPASGEPAPGSEAPADDPMKAMQEALQKPAN